MLDDAFQIADEHLGTRAAREAYARKIGAQDTGYLEITIYARAMWREPKLTDGEIIDKYDLPWDKHPEPYDER